MVKNAGNDNGQQSGQINPVDIEALSQSYVDFYQRSQKIMTEFCKQSMEDKDYQFSDPILIGKAFMDLASKMSADPSKLFEAQGRLLAGYGELWQQTLQRISGEHNEPVINPDKSDKRFKDDAWNEDIVFDTIKQTYLLTSNWLQNVVSDVDGLDAGTRKKVDFYTRQFVDALSPTNFVATNPKVLKKTIDEKGENLIRGMENLLRDLEKGKGQLRISMTDNDAFTLGENIAASKGKVIYQNDMMQLLQYNPSTDKAFKRPLLIVPPWINKFYVLDLQPKNSLIKWAVDQGHTVFVISWVNPDENLSAKGFEDYMIEGPIEAIAAIEKACGETKINIVGYCIGGTLTACTLAYLAAKKLDRVQSATFLTTMVDFEKAGDLSVFIDEEQLDNLEKHMERKGYLEGTEMSQVFSMMRDNDLIWSFVVNNYLMGREPMAFDLLYWNADNTRLPTMMHKTYLREMYLKNKLKDKAGMTLGGVAIDLNKIKVPVYCLATKDDHIAPWKSVYRATGLYKGGVRFVLSASGHIAGVVNPPVAKKYCYWLNDDCPESADDWFDAAKQYDGSWWLDWSDWMKPHHGAKVTARKPGSGKLKAIENAPGSYVKVRIDG